VVKGFKEMKPVVIVGGGITGLAAAWELQQQGVPYMVLEASNRLGGKIKTERTPDGFIIEAGVDSFLTTKPDGYRLCREIGLGDRLIGTNQEKRNVYVLRGGELHLMPRGMRLLVPTDPDGLLESNLISDDGKRQMLAEQNLPPAPSADDESLGAFVRRRFGQEALKVLGEPLLAGIYTGDPETLSMRSVYPSYIEFERQYGSVTRGTLESAQNAQPPADKPPTMFVSLKGGMYELVERLQEVLTGEIRLGTSVTRLASDGSLTLSTGETIETAAVILTVPAQAAAPLLAEVAPEAASQIGEQKVVSSGTVSFAFREGDLSYEPDGYGFVVSADEPSRIVAGTWNSVKLAGRAPAGYVLLRVFIGGHRQPTDAFLPDDELIQVARAEVKRVMGISATPVLTRVNRWLYANPQYEVGHKQRVAKLKAACPGWLQLAGAPYDGIGIPDCVRQGREAARTVSQNIKSLVVSL
jgi:protoporphyrinogen/coproporphyrinogen III oxidase